MSCSHLHSRQLFSPTKIRSPPAPPPPPPPPPVNKNTLAAVDMSYHDYMDV